MIAGLAFAVSAFTRSHAHALTRLATTELTFVRHGETVANATSRYNTRTLNAFSKRGQAEVDLLPTRLAGHYDLILVSPSARAINTILPYLRRTHQRATVWPLLYECCTQRRPTGAHPTSFKYGARFSIPAGDRDVLKILTGEDRLPAAPDYDSGLAQVAAAASEFRTRYMRGSVLLVGHSGQGGHMIHELTGRWIKVDNAKPIRLTLRSSGRVQPQP